MSEIRLNLGCGVHLFSGFLNVDNSFTLEDLKEKKGIFAQAIIEDGAEFLKADMRSLPLETDTVDYIECLEAIEHIPFIDVVKVLREMYRVLKPGGSAVIFTTDFDDIARMWIDEIAGKEHDQYNWWAISSIIYGNQMTEGEFHRSAFNPQYMNTVLQQAGFIDFDLVGYPRGTFPPKFKGAQWPEKTMASGMLYVEARKH